VPLEDCGLDVVAAGRRPLSGGRSLPISTSAPSSRPIFARDGQVQTSPLLNAYRYRTRPSIALSRNASSDAITSSRTMFGDLPPNSVVEGIRFCAV
jgi:hypothetical protein